MSSNLLNQSISIKPIAWLEFQALAEALILITTITECFSIDSSKNMGTLIPLLELICLESITG